MDVQIILLEHSMNHVTEKKRILVVEDSDFERPLMCEVLAFKGYDVQPLSSGQDCIQTIRAQIPSLILLDVMIGNVNGNDILQAIRKEWSPICLPVIQVL